MCFFLWFKIKLMGNFLNILWVILAFIVFLLLLFISAPYGKFTSYKWGPTIPAKFGWFFMETPSSLLFLFYFFTGKHKTGIVEVFFLLIWEFHYVYRAFIYPFRMRGSDRAMPITIVLMALFFNFMNCYFNARYLFWLSPGYSVSWVVNPKFLIGVVLFFVGSYINRQSDMILQNLRQPDDKGYYIPYGGLYKFVTNPNYFGELIIWTGWAMCTWSLAGASFAIWTFANLAPRAVSNHKWYISKFPDYPKQRYILIPFVW